MQSDEELAFGIDGVDVLFLEEDSDAESSQFTSELQRIYRIACESGHGLCEDQVDLPLPALANHTQKLLSLAGRGTGLSLIGKDVGHRPVRVFHDLFCVERLLILIAAKLLITVGRYAAVGSNTQISLLCLLLQRFLLRRNNNDLLLRPLFGHSSSPSPIH